MWDPQSCMKHFTEECVHTPWACPALCVCTCVHIVAYMWIDPQGMSGLPAHSSNKHGCMYVDVVHQLRYSHNRWGTPMTPRGQGWLDRREKGKGKAGGRGAQPAAAAGPQQPQGPPPAHCFPFPNAWGGGCAPHVVPPPTLSNGTPLFVTGGSQQLALPTGGWGKGGGFEHGFHMGGMMAGWQQQMKMMQQQLNITMAPSSYPSRFSELLKQLRLQRRRVLRQMRLHRPSRNTGGSMLACMHSQEAFLKVSFISEDVHSSIGVESFK